MSDWKFLNAHRTRKGYFASTDEMGFTGAFQFNLPGEARRVFCISADSDGWKHVSISFGPNKSIPPWAVMCRVKDLFFEPIDWVVQFHPPESEYVNNHPGCLHLWMPTKDKMPTPPSIMVGIKTLGNLNREQATAALKVLHNRP